MPEFRAAYFPRDYETTLAFYREGLELPVVESWDRGPSDRGTVFEAAYAAQLHRYYHQPDHRQCDRWPENDPPF